MMRYTDQKKIALHQTHMKEIKSMEGKDSIFGCSGNDIIYGNNDDDSIRGDVGNDRLYGE